jgi:hypothetical protein
MVQRTDFANETGAVVMMFIGPLRVCVAAFEVRPALGDEGGLCGSIVQ